MSDDPDLKAFMNLPTKQKGEIMMMAVTLAKCCIDLNLELAYMDDELIVLRRAAAQAKA